MYSHEIDELLKRCNYSLLSNQYVDICHSSPQISCVEYKPFGDYFEMSTYDGYYWKFNVRTGENEND